MADHSTPQMLVLLGATLLAAAACRSDCEPRIVNVDHTPATEAAVQRAHDVFLERLDPRFDVCIREIELSAEDPDPDIAGRYHSARKKIRYIRATPDFVIWHELGHAVYAQNRLEHPEIFEPAPDMRTSASPRHREGETFARAIEYALTFSHLLDGRCPSDEPDVAQLLAALGYVTGPDEPYLFDGPAWEPVGEAVTIAEGVLSRSSLGIVSWELGDGQAATIHLPTGRVSAPGPALAGASPEHIEPGQPLSLSDDVLLQPFVIDGPRSPLAETAVRWVILDTSSSQLRLAGLGCVEPLDHVVAQGDTIYRVRWADGALQVSRLVGLEAT